VSSRRFLCRAVVLPRDRIPTIGGMRSRQRARETHIQVRSLSGPAEHAGLRKSRWNGLLFSVVLLVELLCLSSFAGAPKGRAGGIV
jgi:hypothetical protein